MILYISTLRPRQNGHHLADDIFKSISFNENVFPAQIVPHKHQVSRKIFSLILVCFLFEVLLGTNENKDLKLHREYLWSVTSKLHFGKAVLLETLKSTLSVAMNLKITQQCPKLAWRIFIR